MFPSVEVDYDNIKIMCMYFLKYLFMPEECHFYSVSANK